MVQFKNETHAKRHFGVPYFRAERDASPRQRFQDFLTGSRNPYGILHAKITDLKVGGIDKKSVLASFIVVLIPELGNNELKKESSYSSWMPRSIYTYRSTIPS